jgi:hypothetical protein
MAAPNIRSSSAHNLIHVTVLKPGILWQLLEFFKNSCTLDLSKTLPAFTSPDQIPQTVYLWAVMLLPSLHRNNGITSTEHKHPLNHNLFNSFHPIQGSRDIPTKSNSSSNRGRYQYICMKQDFGYFKQWEDLHCNSQVLLLQFPRWWSPGTWYCAGTDVSREPAMTISGHETTFMCQHGIIYQKSQILIFTTRPFGWAVSRGATVFVMSDTHLRADDIFSSLFKHG